MRHQTICSAVPPHWQVRTPRKSSNEALACAAGTELTSSELAGHVTLHEDRNVLASLPSACATRCSQWLISAVQFAHRVTVWCCALRRGVSGPKAVPIQRRPVTSWNGRVAISFPDAATPITQLTPQPRWAHSRAARITSTLPVQSTAAGNATEAHDGQLSGPRAENGEGHRA